MPEHVLVDSGYWLALFDPRDQHYQKVQEQIPWIEIGKLLVPWPTLYEALRTRLVRRPDRLAQLNRLLKRPNVEFIGDEGYRFEAYELTYESAARRQRSISLVDMVCRLMIADTNLRVDYLLTTNPADFHDVCRARSVIILD